MTLHSPPRSCKLNTFTALLVLSLSSALAAGLDCTDTMCDEQEAVDLQLTCTDTTLTVAPHVCGAAPSLADSLVQVAVRCFDPGAAKQTEYTDQHEFAFTGGVFDDTTVLSVDALVAPCTGGNYIAAARWTLGSVSVQAQCTPSPAGLEVPDCEPPTASDLGDLGERFRLYSMVSPQGPKPSHPDPPFTCFPPGITDHSWIEARSAAHHAYHGVLAGRFICAHPTNTGKLLACEGTGPSVCPDGECGRVTGTNLASGAFAAFEINGDGTFDTCCDHETAAESSGDCTDGDLDCSPYDVQCATAAVFAACRDGAEDCADPLQADFRAFDRVVWLGPVQDIDIGDHSGKPSDLSNPCLRFSFEGVADDLDRIVDPHTFGEAAAPPSENDGCTLGTVSLPDDDFDGIYDECDPVLRNHSPADGFETIVLRNKIRNEGFGSPFEATDLVFFGGVSGQVLAWTPDELTVRVPAGLPLGDLQISVGTIPPEAPVAAQDFVPTWFGYVGDGTTDGLLVFDSAGEATLDGNVSRTNARVNLNCDDSDEVLSVASPHGLALRAIDDPNAPGTFADREVFAVADVILDPSGSESRLFGFGVDDHRLLQSPSFSSGVPLPGPAYAVDVAEDALPGTGTSYVYVVYEHIPGFTKVVRVDVDDATDPAWGSSVSGSLSINGTPVGIRAHYFDSIGRVYAYVTSVLCVGGGSGVAGMGMLGPGPICKECGGGPNPDRRIVYLSVTDVTDPVTGGLVAQHILSESEPGCNVRPPLENVGLMFNEDATLIFVANPDQDRINVIRTDNHILEASIQLPAGSQPMDVALVRPGGAGPATAYAVGHGDGKVRIIDVATYAVSPTFVDLNPSAPPLSPVAIAARSDGLRLFTADSTNRTVSVIDIDPNSGSQNTKTNVLYTGSSATRLVLLGLR